MHSDGTSPLVAIRDVHKSFQDGQAETQVLSGMELEIPKGTFASIVGPSGCGKTTLLSLIGALDTPDEGEIIVDGDDITKYSDRERRQYRGSTTGFVFQFYNLMPTLTGLENIELGLEFLDLTSKERRERARSFLDRVGLADHADKFPNQLSGGQQQRVAVARALARKPKLLLADEPTGNLDEDAGQQVFDLIKSLQREEETTCIMVTHDLRQAENTDLISRLRRGQVEEMEHTV